MADVPEAEKPVEGRPIYVADDKKQPDKSSAAVIFPEDNNVLYKDTSGEVDQEQGESLLGETRKKLGKRKQTKRPDPAKGFCARLLSSPEKIAGIGIGVVLFIMLIIVGVIFLTGGFGNSSASRHVAKHGGAKTGPFGSAHLKKKVTVADKKPHTTSQFEVVSVKDVEAELAKARSTSKEKEAGIVHPTPAPAAKKNGHLPLPNVKGLEPRARVTLEDVQSVEDEVLDEEQVRKSTSSSGAMPDTYAGYVNVDKDRDSNMFFWLAEARDGNRDAPVIVYLMGGPGAPSDAMMVKGIGPREVNEDDSGKLVLTENQHSWNEQYALLLIDQPIGIGFSYTNQKGFAKNDLEVAAHITAGIPTIIHRYGKKDNPLYIFGLSYGGKIAPLVGEGLMTAQEDGSAVATVNLKGVGIGSGWIDPLSIVESYGKHYYERGYITKKVRKEVEAQIKVASGMIKKKDNCAVMGYLVEDGVILKKIREATGILNWYNLRKGYEPAKYFRGVTASLKYVQRVHNLLPVGGRSLEIANGGVNFTAYDYLACSIAVSSKKEVDALLKRKIRVMVYGGEDDGMVPPMSTSAWLSSLTSDPTKDWLDHERKPWAVQGQVAGFWRADDENLLNEVLILGAGHMVEMDQPQVTKEMLEMFVQMDV